MPTKTISTVRFHNYWKLLRLIAPWVEMVIVFNQEGNFIWQSSRRLHPQMDRINILTRKFQLDVKTTELMQSVQDLGDEERLELMQLQDPLIQASLTVALLSQQDKKPPSLDEEHQTTINLLNQTLLTEYALIQQIIVKEQELNAIADELTHRYEELNLVYSSDENVQNLSHGRELLQQIVINASNFLDADMVTIMLPDKDVTLHHSKQTTSANNYHHMLNCLRSEIFLYLKIHKSSIVINRYEDAPGENTFIEMPYKVIISPMLNSDNQVIGLMAIINQNNRIDFTNSDRNLLDVLSNKASSIVLHNFDPLTGLENNHSFEMIVTDALKQSWQNGSHHAVANIDIDRMSVINAISGLEAGDLLIKKIGETLTRLVNPHDTVARLGADKFAILLKNCELENAHAVMLKISCAVSEIELEWKQHHEVSVSIGLAPVSADIQTVSSVLGNAESARIAAKERGRNKIQVFQLDDSDLLRRKEQIKWVSRTQAALRDNRFEIYAQRIHPIQSGQQLPHFEILVRMLDENGVLVKPDQFLPAAENFYLMPKLDRWVIENTFKRLHSQFKQQGQPTCEVSINLSGQSLTDQGLDNFIEHMLEKYQVRPNLLCFEITETSAVANLTEAQAFISKIRQMGCKFSLDDFGTGLSSFAYLQNLQVDYLKIDGSFVRNITHDPVSLSMVSAINQVGHAMQLKTIAEYVENTAILDCLKQLGVDYAQGYAINEPQPFTEQLLSLSHKSKQEPVGLRCS